ncbi:hypothetical protein, conserved [Eimeria brunetti]|uniref:Regulator of chromosome condensation domain-containing protein n=1 Tax=Eimeria brunetti TaxID=51314 RepID=U6LEU5_9EIME|nr:hypothetical protein, conserved [Eimeria brunetti]
MAAGISCHPKGTAFALFFTDGTVLAMGEELQGGEMTAEVKNGLGRFEASRSQRIKTIAATTGAFAVLLQNGSVYAWGDTTVGGELPNPEPSDCSKLIAADVGFAAMTAAGTVYSWGKGVVLPGRLNTAEFQGFAVEMPCLRLPQYGRKKHALLPSPLQVKRKGELAVWGTSTSSAPFCNEGFASSVVRFNERVSVVRFNERAGAAARKRGAQESSPGVWEIVAWGDPEAGAEVPNSLHSVARNGVKSLHSNTAAFLVVGSDNLIGVWGDSSSGGGSIPLEFTHDRPVVSVAELSGSFALIYSSGEVLVYGKGGSSLYSGVSGTTVQEGSVITLEEGTSVVRGIGSTNYFFGAIGTPCVPGQWSACFGSRKRERAIAYEAQNGGSCSTNTIGVETCRGPEAATEDCASLSAAAEPDTDSSSSLPSSISIETIVGIAAAGLGIVLVMGTVIYLWSS